MQFQLLKVETQGIQVFWIYTTFRYNQTQFRRVEVPSLGHHMVYPPLSDPSYELERMISHLNLTIYNHWNEEKYLESLQMNISNRYCEERKHNLYLQLAHIV